jgi:hypothetical protein
MIYAWGMYLATLSLRTGVALVFRSYTRANRRLDPVALATNGIGERRGKPRRYFASPPVWNIM